MSKCLITFILILGSTLSAYAQGFRSDLEWYNSVHGTNREMESLIDPTGRRLTSPRSYAESDLRLNTKYTWRNGTRLVFRPRLVGNVNQYRYFNPDEEETTSTAEASLPEGFLEGDLTGKTTLAIGLQNYQWGPAEMISPTNPFFHFRPDQRAYNYKEAGRFLLRMNWSPNSLWSVIGIIEPMNNGTSFWVYEQEFKPKGMLKLERRGKNALNYVGLNIGTMDDEIPFIGEYFNFEMIQGFSLYLDARHSLGYAKYKPDISPDTLYDMIYFRNTEVWNSLVVTGARWEGSFDLRFEYIYNSYGLSHDNLQAAFISALPSHPRGDQNLKRLMGSGMEFFGKHYGYISLRVPDLLAQNHNLALRYLRSFMDQSGNIQVAYDAAIGDAWTIFADANVSLGDNTQELSALEKVSGTLGLKWNM